MLDLAQTKDEGNCTQYECNYENGANARQTFQVIRYERNEPKG